jgi:hypothetical protein
LKTGKSLAHPGICLEGRIAVLQWNVQGVPSLQEEVQDVSRELSPAYTSEEAGGDVLGDVPAGVGGTRHQKSENNASGMGTSRHGRQPDGIHPGLQNELGCAGFASIFFRFKAKRSEQISISHAFGLFASNFSLPFFRNSRLFSHKIIFRFRFVLLH